MKRKRINDYSGFHPQSSCWTPDRIDPSSISPQIFYEKYVATHTPCIFTSFLTDESFNATKWVDPNYIKSKASDEIVKVEEKGPHGFGTAQKRNKMKFPDFIDSLIVNKREDLYLTTQYEDDNDATSESEATGEHTSVDDQKAFFDVFPPPMKSLTQDFPAKPSLFPTLVLQQTNLWIGQSPQGTSSGLHCDFCENLYILLKGRKRFTLFSPQDAENLYLYGKIKKVFRNGFIEFFHNDEDSVECKFRSDGAYLSDVAKFKVSELQNQIEEMNQQLATNDEIKCTNKEAIEEKIESLEAELDEALEKVLDFGHDNPEGDLDFDFDISKLHDDFDDDCLSSSSVSDTDRCVEASPKLSTSLHSETSLTPAPSEPPSFSKIPTYYLHSSSSSSQRMPGQQFPLLKIATKICFELNEGEMLFLPTGWFHEVTSFSSTTSNADPSPMNTNYHMALNYWFHPPSNATFQQPYEDEYWSSRWSVVNGILERKQSLSTSTYIDNQNTVPPKNEKPSRNAKLDAKKVSLSNANQKRKPLTRTGVVHLGVHADKLRSQFKKQSKSKRNKFRKGVWLVSDVREE